MGLCDRMLWYLRNVHDKMADGETAFEKRSGQTFYGPSILSGTLSEYLEEQAVGQENDEWDMFKLCATCGRRLVRRLDGRRLREICKYQKRQTIYVKRFEKTRSIRNRIIRISVCKRNIETSKPSKTVIDSSVKLRARRC